MPDYQVLDVISNRYELTDKLGEGGMGAVYEAIDRLTSEIVAIKRVRLNKALSEEVAHRTRLALTREFQTLATLRHPNIIGVLDYGFDAEQNPFFAMPLLKDAELFHKAAWERDDLGKVDLLLQMLQALAYIHRRGILHRDLKPGNVLVLTDGQVKVLDFGLAATQEESKETIGTLHYMSPEALAGVGATTLSDLYTFGVMTYEVFARKLPLRSLSNTAEIINDILFGEPDLSLIPYELDVPQPAKDAPAFEAIMNRLLAKEPEDRYPDATSIIQVMSAAAGQPVPTETSAIRNSYLQAANFVGRESEMSQLQMALQAALDGQGSAWLVGGVSGVGKSRLLDELRVQALVNGATVLRGQALRSGRLPYQVWRDPVRRLLLSGLVNDLDASILKAIVPNISSILNMEVEDAPELTGSEAQERLAAAIVRLFRAQQRPIVLIVEDLHWIDESLVPLQLLLQATTDLPLLIVGSYRSDEQPDLPEQLPEAAHIMLGRLQNDAMQQLAVSMLGEAGINDQLVALLERETSGNVFFLVETVRALADEAGSLDAVGRMTLPQQVFAGGVRDVMERRLSYIPDAYRPLLVLAAVAGRTLDFAVLEHLVVHSVDETISAVSLDDWLTTCANLAVFINWDERWRFAHDKLRDALTADLDEDDLRGLHRVVAEALEATYPDDPTYYRALAEHWYQAQDSQRAAHFALLAGQQALNTGSYTDALTLFERVLSNRLDAAIQMRLHKLIADAHEGHSAYDQAFANYNWSFQIAKQIKDPIGVTSALDGKGDVADKRGDFQDAQKYYQQALAIARQTELPAQIAETLKGLGTVAAKRGQLDTAQTNFNEALTITRELDDLRGVAANLNNLGIVMRLKGQLRQGQSYLQEALELRQSIGDQRGIASTLSNLGIISRILADYEGALAYYESGADIFRTIGDLRGTATILNNIGIIQKNQGDLEAAAATYEECVRLGERIGDQRTVAYAQQNLGTIASSRGDAETALKFLARSLETMKAIGDAKGQANTLRDLGLVFMQAERHEAALEQFEKAFKRYDALGDQRAMTSIRVHLGRAALYVDVALARAVLAEALSLAEESESEDLVMWVLSALAEWMWITGEQTTAAQLIADLKAADWHETGLDYMLESLEDAPTQRTLQDWIVLLK